MEKNYFLIIVLLLTAALSFGQTSNPFISEIHYDNCGGGFLCLGADTDEGVEITGTPGFDLTGWDIVLYEGQNGEVYNTISLSGLIPANGVLWTPINDIEDGSITIFNYTFLFPAGVALVNTNTDPDEVVEFLSYEGAFTAVDGPASGLTSTNIGVSEQWNTAVGLSLQRTDAGWVGPIAATPGLPNNGLTLSVVKNNIKGFKMYPNPVSNGTFQMQFEDNNEKLVEVYSLIGKQVMSLKITSKEVIDVSNLSTGFYMVRVEDEGRIATKKLVIK